MSLWIVYLIAAAVLMIIELLTGFVATFCVAIGCVIAAVLDFMGLSIEAQLVGLAVGVIVAFILFAPLINHLRKKHNVHREEYNSNMNALIGREVFVPQSIPGGGGVGRVTVDGDSWQAVSNSGDAIESGVRVRVTGYDSIILTVKPVI